MWWRTSFPCFSESKQRNLTNSRHCNDFKVAVHGRDMAITGVRRKALCGSRSLGRYTDSLRAEGRMSLHGPPELSRGHLGEGISPIVLGNFRQDPPSLWYRLLPSY